MLQAGICNQHIELAVKPDKIVDPLLDHRLERDIHLDGMRTASGRLDFGLDRPAPARRPVSANDVELPPGERAVLIEAAQFGSVEREQLTVLTGYKQSSRGAYIQRLREKGLVVVSGSTISPTDGGLGAGKRQSEINRALVLV